MNQAVLRDIEESGTRAAMPIVGQTADKVFLETVEVGQGEDAGFQAADVLIDAELAIGESPALSGAIVRDPDGAVETERERGGGERRRGRRRDSGSRPLVGRSLW